MDEEALDKYLEENLRIRCEDSWSCYVPTVKVQLYLKDKLISEDYFVNK